MRIIRPDKDMATWVERTLTFKDFDNREITNPGTTHCVIGELVKPDHKVVDVVKGRWCPWCFAGKSLLDLINKELRCLAPLLSTAILCNMIASFIDGGHGQQKRIFVADIDVELCNGLHPLLGSVWYIQNVAKDARVHNVDTRHGPRLPVVGAVQASRAHPVAFSQDSVAL